MVTVNGSFSLLDHENQRPDLGYDFENRGYTVSVNLTPAGGKRLSANLDYSRADLTSDILFIIPQLLTSDRSLYIEQPFWKSQLGIRNLSRRPLQSGV